MFGPNIFPLARLVATALLASTALAAAQSMEGQGWDATTRNNFYTQDQGTRLIPWSWISALEQANGAPFMADGLARYGYLPNPGSAPAGLPVGFMVARGGVDGRSSMVARAIASTAALRSPTSAPFGPISMRRWAAR
jgi:hypothetical protein